MIADSEGDISNLFHVETKGDVPILATRNMMMFPGVLCLILIGRESSLKLIEKAKKAPNTIFAILCQRDADVEEPHQENLYAYGVYARLVRVLEMPGHGQNVTTIIQAMRRCKLEKVTKTKPFLQGSTTITPKVLPELNDEEYQTTAEDFRKQTIEYIKKSDDIADKAQFALNNIQNNILNINYVCTNMPFTNEDKMSMLETNSMNERIMILLRVLNKEMQLLELKKQVRMKACEDLDEQQREYFLQQQTKNIKEELGDGEGSPERRDLETKVKKKKWTTEARNTFYKELEKLEMYNPQSPEYSVQLNYLQTMVNLPWGEYTADNLDLKRAQHTLDRDHCGMEKVKEHILEYMTVLQLRGNLKSPILCLYSPPGVGKTSLGESITSAVKRKYVRILLEGIHDELGICGHRRTYIGAMPGHIIRSLQKAGSSNPVFTLGRIDKVTQNTISGDPSSALFETLGPEQNNIFHDNYLDVDYGLSHVTFIATANDLNTIPRPLLDRMEIIKVSDYITEEKIEIAKRHLVPRELESTGLDTDEPKIKFNKAPLEKIIEQYIRGSGVRQLEKQVNKALRKMTFNKAMDSELTYADITPGKLESLLDKPPFYRDIYQGNDYAGVVTGLAWTSVGGEILFIETSLSKGKPGKLTLTGNLGDVMKESAVIAFEYVKAHVDALGIDYRLFEQWNIHIHVPEGTTPKNGPSAGTTIATSIASALTQRKVRKNTAMTGEITLRGKALPMGGIKEKILAAKRAGITDIVMCKKNKKDVDEIPEKYLKGVESYYVENVQQVWDFALTNERVEYPMNLIIQEVPDKTTSDPYTILL